MSEKSQRVRVLRAVKPLHGLAVENRVGVGTPDVNFSQGWIELKWIRRWPMRKDSPVRLTHFTPAQKRFLKRRWDVNKSAWLLLQVEAGDQWLLFDGGTAATMVDGTDTRADFNNMAVKVWYKGFVEEELRQCLLKSAN